MKINNPDQYAAFFWAENNITHPDHEYIFHLDTPRCMIKFRKDLAMFASFNQFYKNVAEVQWLDGPGSAPTGKELQEFLVKAWNYFAIEERILEEDLNDMDDDF